MNNVAGRLEKETKFYESMEKKLQTMAPIFKEYYTFMRANRMSYSTIREYVNQVLHFANFVTNENITNDFYQYITPGDVESYIISLETKQTKDGIKRMGDDILQTRWSSLNKFFTWLIKRGYTKENPIQAVDRPRNNVERKVIYLNKAEISKLFKMVEKNPNRIVKSRDKALFSLAIATGLRAGALTNINLDDFDWENKIVKVIEKRQKTREIPLGENTINILKEWIEVRNREFDDVNSTALFISQKKLKYMF
jgi:site-specific recombinase XerC